MTHRRYIASLLVTVSETNITMPWAQKRKARDDQPPTKRQTPNAFWQCAA
jgi:hypothetical protein